MSHFWFVSFGGAAPGRRVLASSPEGAKRVAEKAERIMRATRVYLRARGLSVLSVPKKATATSVADQGHAGSGSDSCPLCRGSLFNK